MWFLEHTVMWKRQSAKVLPIVSYISCNKEKNIRKCTHTILQKIYRKDKPKNKEVGYMQRLDRKGLESSMEQEQVVGLRRKGYLSDILW